MSGVATACVPPDTLRSCPDGRYDDGVVRVRRGGHAGLSARRGVDGRVEVEHRFGPSELDDELGPALAAALAPLTDDHDVFGRAFTGMVLTSQPYASAAWDLFYRNSLARIRHRSAPGYSALYRHAFELLPTTSVVDLGCSFGFLALHLAARGVAVTACDTDAGATALLRRMSRRLQHPIDVRTTGAGHVALPDRCADGVALLHVLEHVGPDEAGVVLAEAQRLARHRVVVAVPYEDEPTALYGHVRRVDAGELRARGAASGWHFDVHDHAGGWLVLDRPAAGNDGRPLG